MEEWKKQVVRTMSEKEAIDWSDRNDLFRTQVIMGPTAKRIFVAGPKGTEATGNVTVEQFRELAKQMGFAVQIAEFEPSVPPSEVLAHDEICFEVDGKIDNFATHLMAEQNLVSDYLPVVSHDKQRSEPSIDYFDKGRDKLVRFVRKVDGKLPGKGHAKLWFFICASTMAYASKLKRSMEAAGRDTCNAPIEPRIPYTETDILRFYNKGENRKWCEQDYAMARDGLRSFAGLSIEECSAFFFADGLATRDAANYNGNLIYLNSDQGWFAPGRFLWESSWHNSKMALPLQTLHKLDSTSSMTLQLMAILCRRWYRKPEGVALKLSTVMRCLRIEGRKPTEALKTIRSLNQTLAGKSQFLRRKPVEHGKGLDRKLHFVPGEGAKFPTREKAATLGTRTFPKRLATSKAKSKAEPPDHASTDPGNTFSESGRLAASEILAKLSAGNEKSLVEQFDMNALVAPRRKRTQKPRST